MCYSAQIKADWVRYRRQYGADISLADFHDLFFRRARDASKPKVPKALEVAFTAAPASDAERAIAALIDEHRRAETMRVEQELFKQRKRLGDAERALQSRPTKAAAESRRIAGDKIAALLSRRASLHTDALTVDEQRIFPGHYAPVIVWDGGRRVVKPMRYQCRPPGRPAACDARFPGTYNARRDNLGGPFWRDLFGCTHGVLVIDAFFENVDRGDGNVVLEFRPQPRREMLVACLYSRWSAPGEADLWSFAAITDDPPPEVAAAGHDRCVVPIRPEHVNAWLQPGGDLRAMQAILDDHDRPYYEHRLAA